MRALVISTLMLTTLAFAGTAVAQTDTPPADPAQVAPKDAKKAAKKDDDGVVCRRERVTGSNRPVKVCTSALQRDLDKDAANRLLEGRAPTPNEAPSN